MNKILRGLLFKIPIFLEFFMNTYGIGEVCRLKKRFGVCLPIEDCFTKYKTSWASCGRNVCCFDPPAIRDNCLKYQKEIFGDEATCNKSKILRNRIVGGQIVDPLELPHMAAIGFENERSGVIEWHCGGTVISPSHIMTAAHCLVKPVDSIRILAGSINLNDRRAEVRGVVEAIKHPKYHTFNNIHDLAILRLQEPFQLSERIVPACLLYEHEQGPISKALAAGWGKLDEDDDDDTVNTLRKVEIEVIELNECKKFHPTLVKYGGFHPSMLCAGHIPGGKDTCQGDSGGPLSIKMESIPCTFGTFGVLSFGAVCGWANSPAIYTRLSYYLTWIVTRVWPEAIS